MKRYFFRLACITVMGTLTIATNEILASDVIYQETIYQKTLLSAEDLMSVVLLKDRTNQIAVFYSTGYPRFRYARAGFGTRASLLVRDGKDWATSERRLDDYVSWNTILRNGVLQELYTLTKSNVYDVSLYKITPDLKLPKEPYTVISRKGSVGYGGDIRQLVSISEEPNLYFIIGQYTQFSLDPITIMSHLLSGGHGDRRERPYGAVVENGAITGYYKIPGEKLRFRDTIGEMYAIPVDQKIHMVWAKHQDGVAPERELLQYSCFDLNDKAWSQAVMPFSYKLRKDMKYYCSGPMLIRHNEILYCTWRWGIFPKNDEKQVVNTSGVYVSSKKDQEWSVPIHIAHSGRWPIMLPDTIGTLYIFWCEKGKGIFYKANTPGGWKTPAQVVIKDPLVRSKPLYYFRKRPYDLVFDKENILHIVYARNDDPKELMDAGKLIYAKVKLD